MYVTFTGPCFMIHSYNKSQLDALFLNFILVKNSSEVRMTSLADSQHN